jgi:hypothetical protein
MFKNFNSAILLVTVILFLSIFSFPAKAAVAKSYWSDGISQSNTYVYASLPFGSGQVTTDNSYVSFWYDDRTLTDRRDLYAQKVNAAGAKLWGNDGVRLSTVVDSGATANFGNSDINSDNEVFAVWIDSWSISTTRIRAQKLDVNGNRLWGTNGVGPISSVSDTNTPLIAADNAGGAYVIWLDHNSVPAKMRVQRLDTDGNLLWSASGLTVSDDVGAEESRYEIVSDSNGDLIIAWSDVSGTGGMFVQKLNSSGAKQWGANGVEISPVVPVTNDYILLREVGANLMAAWDSDTNDNIHIQQINASGVPQWTAGGVVASTTVDYILDFKKTGTADVVVTWADVNDGTYHVTKVLDNSGLAFTSMIADADSYPYIVGDAAGGIYAVIEHYAYTPVNVGILHLGADGNMKWNTEHILSSGSFDMYPKSINISPVTDSPFIQLEKCVDAPCNSYESEVDYLYSQYQISDLISSLSAVDVNDVSIEADATDGKTGAAETVRIKDNDSGLLIAEVTTDMTSDRSWPAVTGDANLASGKSVVTDLVTSAGTVATHSLYIPKTGANDSVRICPDAVFLTDVTTVCANGYTVSSPTVVTISAQDYFRVDGLTGTGGMGIIAPANSTPAITSLNATPNPANEGSSVTLTINFTDADGADTHEVTVNWGDGNTIVYNLAAGVLTASPTHIYQNNPVTNPITIDVTVEDIASATDTDSTTVTVNNVAPTLNSNQATGSTLTKTLSGNIVDPGSLDTLTLVIDWGDGSTDSTLNLAAATTAFTTDHTFATAGTYDATLTITDMDGDSNNYSLSITAESPASPTQSSNSSSAEATPIVETITPLNPSEGDVSTNNKPVFDWSEPANVDDVVQYQIYLVKIADADGNQLNYPADFLIPTYLIGVVNDGDTTQFTAIQPLSPGTYRWGVVAIDESSQRIGKSTTGEFTIKAAPVTSAPVQSSSTSAPANSTSTTGTFVIGDVGSDKLIASNSVLAATPLIVGTLATLAIAAISGNSLNGIIIGLFIPRKRKHWGIVFDTATDKPISLAVVRLFNTQGNLVTMAVTDAKGIYGLLVDKLGNYTLKVEAVGYHDYALPLNLYTPDAVVDIPMSPDQVLRNPFVKFYIAHREEVISGLRIGLLIALIFGLVYSTFAVFQSPVLVNYLILIAYAILTIPGVLMLLRPLINKVRGQVVDEATGKGISGVIVRFIAANGQVLAISNINGLVKVNLPAGDYSVLANKDGYELVSTQQNALGMKQVKVRVNAQGGIDQRLVMQKIGDTNSVGNLATPFGG